MGVGRRGWSPLPWGGKFWEKKINKKQKFYGKTVKIFFQLVEIWGEMQGGGVGENHISPSPWEISYLRAWLYLHKARAYKTLVRMLPFKSGKWKNSI